MKVYSRCEVPGQTYDESFQNCNVSEAEVSTTTFERKDIRIELIRHWYRCCHCLVYKKIEAKIKSVIR